MNGDRNDNTVEVYNISNEDKGQEFPYVGAVPAGFPSPASDFSLEPLNILGRYMRNPEAIFIGKAYGVSMDGFINDGDYFYMDRSLRLNPMDGDIVVCAIDGEFTLKKLKLTEDGIDLIPYNKDFPIIHVSQEDHFSIWAVVILIVKPTPTRCLR